MQTGSSSLKMAVDIPVTNIFSKHTQPGNGQSKYAPSKRSTTPERIKTLCNQGLLMEAIVELKKQSDSPLQLWNFVIKQCVNNGFNHHAISLYNHLKKSGQNPDNFTFPSVLKACANIGDFQTAQLVRKHVDELELCSDLFVCNSVLHMYCKFGCFDLARQFFDEMSERNLVSWNTIISGSAQNARKLFDEMPERNYVDEPLGLFSRMLYSGTKPDSVTVSSLLSLCSKWGLIREGKTIHALILRHSLIRNDDFVASALVDFYCKCGFVQSAKELLEYLVEITEIAGSAPWNSFISGCSRHGLPNQSFEAFRKMQSSGLEPDYVTFLAILSACSQVGALNRGRELHCQSLKFDFGSHNLLTNSLIVMYSECGKLELAQKIFAGLNHRDLVHWNSIIHGCSRGGSSMEALNLFRKMLECHIKPSRSTILGVLPACSSLLNGMEVHSYTLKNHIFYDNFIGTALLEMYCRCARTGRARWIFDRLKTRDTTAWNTLISGYVQNYQPNEALEAFQEMQLSQTKPDTTTMATVLPSCSLLGALEQGKQIHAFVLRSTFVSNLFVGNALIDMYAKCGSIKCALAVFEQMLDKDIVSWNTLISGYGLSGNGREAIRLFNRMCHWNLAIPDKVTFIGLLSACSHGGLIEEGYQFFAKMKYNYKLEPCLEHYSCMVDLLGRAGDLKMARKLIMEMPMEPNYVVWGTLLGASLIHGDAKMGELAAEKVLELSPENSSYYVLLSNLYGELGRWEDAREVWKFMKKRGVRKEAGCSWIQKGQEVHCFIAGDRSHPESERIYGKLTELLEHMRDQGYIGSKK